MKDEINFLEFLADDSNCLKVQKLPTWAKHNILARIKELKGWVLNYCIKCHQMTNHEIAGKCLKCNYDSNAKGGEQ